MFLRRGCGRFLPAIVAKRHGGIPSKQTTSGLPPQKEANMEQISYFRVGDYFLPTIKLSDPPDALPLGLYGELHLHNRNSGTGGQPPALT